MSLPSVLKRGCLSLIGAGLLCACSSEDSGSSGNAATAAAGTGGAISAGETAEPDGTAGTVESTGATGGGNVENAGGGTTSTGGRVETSGATTGGTGVESGRGGAESGRSGVETGGAGVVTGGAGVVTGGAGVVTGGAGVDTGGAGVATGGAGVETGGTTTGSGGGSTSGAAAGGSTGGTVVTSPNDFTEDQVPGVSFDMVHVPGGTFTLGCESDPCPADTAPVSDVTVSSYYIGKSEVTTELWNAVMGDSSDPSGPMRAMTWYDAMAFACQLSEMTGKRYRMTTEAEWEYAAKNHLNSLEDIGSTEEWAYNSWSSTHSGGTDPVGPGSGQHTQKTRRDPEGTVDNITGRLIRSIDGVGPALRLAISAKMDFPPDMAPPCSITMISTCPFCQNSYRDPRWITGSDAHWTVDDSGLDSFDLRVWEDGTATLNGTDGQWFTSNDIAFGFVSSSGALTQYPYILFDETQGSVISDQSIMNGGYVGGIVKESTDSYAKPAIAGLQSGAELAAAAGDDYEMIDMVDIPEWAREQDPRLLDGPDQGWFQNNVGLGGTHNYRMDVDEDELRFAVINDGDSVMLANGQWFTVNDTFLRIEHPEGYIAEYLYALNSDGHLVLNSYQGYDRGDVRMFRIYSNTSGDFPPTCIDNSCSEEIPKGQDAPSYSTLEVGHSTFVPAPCPVSGCE